MFWFSRLAAVLMFMGGATIGVLAESSYLEKSDQAFIPRTCRYDLTVFVDKNGVERTYSFKGLKKGSEENLLLTRSPKSSYGIAHLRRGGSIWTYYPTIGQSYRVSYQALFLNSVLNYGDILSTQLDRDYDIQKMEINRSSTIGVVVLTLVPRPQTQGYAKIVLRIDEKTFLPISRDYYAFSGMVIKKMVFTIDRTRESPIYIQEFEEPLKQTKTTVKYSNIQSSEVDSSVFNPSSIPYLR